ncbi:MAG: DUF4065 domain-containing protein [Gammaproteobacteria bacterium]|nr:DUF4065 domain-containing protein [Gammaproteobacteria bacterium]
MALLEQSPPLDTHTLSDCILFERKDRQQETTGLDLMNLVYLCHSWYLGIYGSPLIDEKVQAWANGPGIPSVYNRFPALSNLPIRIDGWIDPRTTVGLITNNQSALIHSVLDTYNNFDSWSLSAIAHRPGSPWDQIRIIYGIGEIIPNELIQEHYGRLYRAHNARKQKEPA